MQIKSLLTEEYQKITSEEEKAVFMNDLLIFTWEISQQKTSTISQLMVERDHLKNKVDRAAELIANAKNETAKTRKAATGEIKKKLQITRDRILAIDATSSALGKQINQEENQALMADTLNNIIASVKIIFEELSNAGLWDDDEARPMGEPVIVKNNNTAALPEQK